MIIGDLSIFDQVLYAKRSRQLDLLARGDYSPIQDELRAAYPRTSLPVRAIPFVQRYIAELGGLYSRPVVRRFLPRTMPTATWQTLQSVYDQSRIDRAMEQAETSLWTQNVAILLPIPDGIGRVKVVQILPWMVERIDVSDPLMAHDPRSWDRLIAQVPSASIGGQVVMGRLELTPSSATRQVGGSTVGIYSPDGSHPFGAVPVAVAHRIQPDAGRPLPPVHEAVLNLQVALSLQQADSELIVRSCAYPQRWIANATVSQTVETLSHGPDKFLALVRSGSPDDPAPSLQVAQGHVPVAELVSFAEHQIRLYCSMLGLDPSNFLRSNTATTAAARLFAAQDRQALRARLEPVLIQLERDLLALVAPILGLRESMRYPADLSVDVQWSVSEPQPDPQSAAQAAKAEVELGLTSPVDIVANRDGIGRTEAKKIVEANLEEARALGLIAPTVATTTDQGQGNQPAGDQKPADQAMNGAQVGSLVGVISQVAAGTLPASAARLVIASAFPTLDPSTVEAMVSAAVSFTPTTTTAASVLGGTP